MRTCVIFNPVARGDKARAFRAQLDRMGTACDLRPTAAAGEGRRLAREAIEAGYERLIAAGGDGTLNEVLNGMGDAPEGFTRACLGVLPLGTVNVFARELKMPLQPEAAWACLQTACATRVDLGVVDFTSEGKPERRYFAQLAGAGLDARAIELVSWSLKKKFGKLAYVIAGLKAMLEKGPTVVAGDGKHRVEGQLVLIGNGRLYGGDYEILEGADLQDGRLHVCAFPKLGWWTLLRCGVPLVLKGRLPEGSVRRFRAREFTVTSAQRAAFELEGDLVGHLPAKFSVIPQGLRVLMPKQP